MKSFNISSILFSSQQSYVGKLEDTLPALKSKFHMSKFLLYKALMF